MLTKRTKSGIVKKHQKHETDTGSASVQVGILTRRIDELARHLKGNPKDEHSRTGLLKMVSRRRRLLSYLEREDPKAYKRTVEELGLKK